MTRCVDFDLFISDLNGNLRGKRLPGSAFERVMREGVKLPRSVVSVDFWGNDVLDTGLVFETGDSDGVCWPVTNELLPVPWASSPRNQVLAMMFNPDGTPFAVDPRQVLQNVLTQYERMQLKPVVATELEFYLMDAESGAIGRPVAPKTWNQTGRRLNKPDVYSLTDIDGFSEFFDDARAACEAQGISSDTIIAEMGPGQFEINLRHVADPLLAADQTVMFKRMVKGVARLHGYTGTFMPKPYSDQSGSGFHVHFSLLDAADNNVFDSGGPEGSAVMQNAVAGMLNAMPESMLIYAPTLNSYRRFVPGTHAPTLACWGYENRTVAVRIPDGSNASRRIEHRVAGADANPYLVLASVLAGALYGIQRELLPRPAVCGNAYAQHGGDVALPCQWGSAMQEFERGNILREYLGEEFVRAYLSVKRQEHSKLNALVTDVEYNSYLNYL